MKNTVKLFVAAFVVAIATSCGGEKKENAENQDTVTVGTPAPAADTTTTSAPADTTAADTTATR